MTTFAIVILSSIITTTIGLVIGFYAGMKTSARILAEGKTDYDLVKRQ